MALIKCMDVAAVLFIVAFAVAQANQCSSGGECPAGNKPNNVVSMLQTKLQMNALEDEGGGECPGDDKPKSIVSLLQTKLQMNVEEQVASKEKAEEVAAAAAVAAVATDRASAQHEAEAAEAQNIVDTSIAGHGRKWEKAHADVETSATKGQKTKLLLLSGPDVVYNHFPKAGGTFVEYVLKHSVRMHNLKIETEGKSVTRRDREVAFTIGSMRNPCDYYVSLWAFGSIGRGAFRKQIPDRYYGLSPHLNTTEDLQRFSHWLRYIMPDGKPGLESARLARSYSPEGLPFNLDNTWLRTASTPLRNLLQDTIEAFNTSSVDCWVKTENLTDDLKRCLEAYEESTGAAVVDWAKFKNTVNFHAAPDKSGKGSVTNRSPHQSCAFYYNDANKAFVQNSDQAIFEKFDYDTCCAPLQL